MMTDDDDDDDKVEQKKKSRKKMTHVWLCEPVSRNISVVRGIGVVPAS